MRKFIVFTILTGIWSISPVLGQNPVFITQQKGPILYFHVANDNVHTTADVYTLSGKRIARVFDKIVSHGDYSFNPFAGSNLPQQMYIVRLTNGTRTESISMMNLGNTSISKSNLNPNQALSAKLAKVASDNKVPTNIPGVFTIAAPPQGFDPVTAKDVDLAYYGFPPRPDSSISPKGFAAWKKGVTLSKTRIMPILKQTNLHYSPMQTTSPNWCGIVAEPHNPFTHAYGDNGCVYYLYGTFMVPVAQQAHGSCTGNWDYGASWLGIDGFFNHPVDLLQSGIAFDAYCNGGVTYTSYYAWYEWVPAAAVSIQNVTITPGDVIWIEVWSTSATEGNVYVSNANTQQSFYIDFQAPPGTQLLGNSAEWITERPLLSNGQLATLTNYTYVPFWDSYVWTFGGSTYPFSDPYGFGINMVDASNNVISKQGLPGENSVVTEAAGPALGGNYFYDPW